MYKVTFVLLLILLSNTIKPQKVELGFRFETLGMHRSYKETLNGVSKNTGSDFFMAPFFTTFQTNIALYPSEKVSIEARFDREFLWDNFIGFDYGIFSKYFFREYAYVTGGLALHVNDGGHGGISSGSFRARIYMPSAGIGAKISRVTGFELLFQYAGSKGIGSSWYNYGYHSGDIASNITAADWLIKLNLVFGWKL
ncbi:MAG: hypothetical protein HF314_03235 [Ignavibacteria bacterium]|jgi:hypothetical protein|nr:hypothetical protein [Ignavibacteria bacterium]MCU7502063.1 hypothetical protein [Ignavibacteria bacterium]MCU7515465.1 hypothetical protein [Ignavibacteria bacterium]